MTVYDYLVVGSGCSGAMAAETLVNAGVKVTMLDVGITGPKPSASIPDKDFISIRKNEPEQYRYLIGDKAEGVMWGKMGKGEQITPPRQHILKLVDEYLPVKSTTFSPLESLGYGGLGIGWGLQCWEYSKADLKRTGLNAIRMYQAYETVAARIGISATKDDAAPYTIGRLKTYQPSAAMDRNHRLIYEKYLAKKSRLNKKGFYLGRTPLSLITKDFKGRNKYAYQDMDFYSDNDRSAWRPWMTVDELKKKNNFSYIDGYLLVSFHEKQNYVEVNCLHVLTRKSVIFRCRKLVLATGAMSSARIVLRSLKKEAARLPLLCNPYSYVPCIQPALVGKGVEAKKLGFTQLSLFLDEAHTNAGASAASLYSYQSLMLFRIIRHVPFNFIDARILMRYLMSGLVILGIHHPDQSTDYKYLKLVADPKAPTGDTLHISYSLNDLERRRSRQKEKKFVWTMRALGTYGIKRINPGYGASIHYAGTIPFSREDKEFTLSPSGRLHGTKNIYVADSSGFNYLPAPGLTFSLMANAHIVAQNVLKNG